MTLMRGTRPATPEEVALSTLKATRIEAIAEHRRALTWTRQLQRELAEQWGIPRKTMEELAAEAGRVVAREVTNRDDVTADVGVVLRQIVTAGDAEDRDKIKAGEVWARLAGAMVDRSEVAHVQPVTTSEEWAELREVILRALEPHPEAYASVVAALEAYAGSRPAAEP
jgi:hypothetical protein